MLLKLIHIYIYLDISMKFKFRIFLIKNTLSLINKNKRSYIISKTPILKFFLISFFNDELINKILQKKYLYEM
jgi:hypothetical protein